MKIGDIVQWVPSYAKNKYMSSWLGIILKIREAPDGMQAKVYWFKNKENYYAADWTPIQQLKNISAS